MSEIQEPAALDRIATNLALIAGAISTLAAAVNGEYGGKPIGSSPSLPPAEPQKRGRGRPVKGEDPAPALTAQASVTSATTLTPAAAAAEPFETAAAPKASLEQVREALTALKNVSTQDIALGVLKEIGFVPNITELKAENYGLVVQAANAKAATYAKAPAPEADPWEIPAAMPAVKLTLEDVKAAAVAAGKTTSQDTVQKVVMKHGGKGALPTGGEGPSLKALPEANYAACIAEIQALPKTK